MPNHIYSRRQVLKLLAASVGATVTLRSAVRADGSRTVGPDSNGPTVGIALGAGGANGLAHILMLEALDELSVRPHRIAGSSIGAIIGALYASGISGSQVRKLVEQFIISPDEPVVEELLNKGALRWVEFLELDLGNGGLLSSEAFISFLYETIRQKTFARLEIPLKIVAADMWSREQVVLQSGLLLPSIKASMALPGVFQPEVIDNRLLIDGGTVNPVPYDLLLDECDIVIAVDVIGERTRPEALVPSYFETLFNAAKVMQQSIMNEKRRHRAPTIYLAPHIVDIRALEFYRANEVFAQAQTAKEELKERLTELLEA